MRIGSGFLKNENLIKVLFLIIVLVLFIGNLFIVREIKRTGSSVSNKNPKYHFYFITQNSVDPFWEEVRKGAMEAAKDYNVVLEFNSPRFNNSEEEAKYLDIAILSQVDGIITHAVNNEDFIKLIDEAYERGIPVVTVENDAKDSKRKAFVGTNSFLIGEEAGKLIKNATNSEVKVAIIMNSDSQKDMISKNLVINGFLHAIKNDERIKLFKIYSSKFGIYSAEEITQSIIRDGMVNAIFTLDVINTIGVTQSIVDFNKVGNIIIVGYGSTPEIIRYIDKGIIYGSIEVNPYKMGYESVKAMVEIKEKNATSSFIDTGVNVITKDNYKYYNKKN